MAAQDHRLTGSILRALGLTVCTLLAIGGSFAFMPRFARAQAVSQATGQAQDQPAEFRIFDATEPHLERRVLLQPNLGAGRDLALAVADTRGDGSHEIAVGAGPGAEPWVVIYDSEGRIVNSFLAFESGFAGGIRLAAGDLDGDGTDEIVVSRGRGAPEIRIFDGYGNPRFVLGFMAFDGALSGGANVAAGDLDGDGMDEIIVGSGTGQAAEIRAFDLHGMPALRPFRIPGMDKERHGINVLASDGRIMASTRSKEHPQIWILDTSGDLQSAFSAYDIGFRGGVNMASADTDGDGTRELITAPGKTGGPHVRVFNGNNELIWEFFAFESEFRGGLAVAAGDTDGDGRTEIVTLTQNLAGPEDEAGKRIEIDISEQALFALEFEQTALEFPVSSGIMRFPTPTGDFEVISKQESVRMSWYYGAGNPLNYNLPEVPHVLTFLGPYAIHGTYWHDSFGQTMSHGCVNLALEDAAALYQWAEVGTPVIVRY